MPCTSEGIVWTGSSVVRVANADGCAVSRTHVHACPLNTAFRRLHSWHAVVDREWLEVRRQTGCYNSQVDWPRNSWLRTLLSPVVGPWGNPWYVGADRSSCWPHGWRVRKLSEESTVTPRLRTDVTGMICWPQNVIGELLSCARRRAVAHRMNCVFEGLRLRRLDCIQRAISSRQCSRRSSTGSVTCGLLNTYICESSAYKWTSTPNRRAMISRSAVYSRNRRGPSTEPCGTPNNTVLTVDFTPLYRTCSIRSFR